MVTVKAIPTFFERVGSAVAPPGVKRIKHDEGGSTGSSGTRDLRDPPENSQGFKMRLVNRDKGCVVCLAIGIQNVYRSCDDSNHFNGAHIFPLAFNELWDKGEYIRLIRDPFTEPANANDKLVSPSTRSTKDFRRMNSLDNGILLCAKHHAEYDGFYFSIHPHTHRIFSFHTSCIKLHDIQVTAPWTGGSALFPPPLPQLLEMHYFTSISKAMKGNADDDELEDDDDEFEELSEPEEVLDEQV